MRLRPRSGRDVARGSVKGHIDQLSMADLPAERHWTCLLALERRWSTPSDLIERTLLSNREVPEQGTHSGRTREPHEALPLTESSVSERKNTLAQMNVGGAVAR